MCVEFHARWCEAATGEKEKNVAVEISTSRRETSPVMIVNGEEEIFKGIKARILALVCDGEITSVRYNEKTSFMRIRAANGAELTFI